MGLQDAVAERGRIQVPGPAKLVLGRASNRQGHGRRGLRHTGRETRYSEGAARARGPVASSAFSEGGDAALGDRRREAMKLFKERLVQLILERGPLQAPGAAKLLGRDRRFKQAMSEQRLRLPTFLVLFDDLITRRRGPQTVVSLAPASRSRPTGRQLEGAVVANAIEALDVGLNWLEQQSNAPCPQDFMSSAIDGELARIQSD